MTSGYILIIICNLFAFSCALIKQLYDAKYYPKNIYVFIIDVILSGISGVILSFLFSELCKNDLMLIGISGLGSIFGVNGLKMLIKYNLDQKVNLSILEVQLEEESITEKKANLKSKKHKIKKFNKNFKYYKHLRS